MSQAAKLKRVRAGRYEDGTYGVRRVEFAPSMAPWQTFVLAREEDSDGGWMQSYETLRDAKAGLEELRGAKR